MNPNSFLKSTPIKGMVSAVAVFLLGTTMTAPATVLFSDNFNVDSSAAWTVNVAPAANAAQQGAKFAFDYSPFGIPPAPGSSDTLGLRLRSNVPGSDAVPVTNRPPGFLSGLSVSPTGKDFGLSYRLSFYAWANFNGSANAMGLQDNANSEGGTHNVMFAVGTSGTVPLVVGNTALVSGGQMDGIGFATTGDGGILQDYRIYPKSGTFAPTNGGAYQASLALNTAPYYSAIPTLIFHSAPAIQQTLSTAEYADAINTQGGASQTGAFGFAWHKVTITKITNNVTWAIDGYTIGTLDVTALLPLGGNNIAIGDSDVNTTTTRHPSLLFTLIDNLVVSDIPPSPSVNSSLSSTNIMLSWSKATGGDFIPQYVNSLTPPLLWSNVVAATSEISGTISVSLSATNSTKFFRLKLP